MEGETKCNENINSPGQRFTKEEYLLVGFFYLNDDGFVTRETKFSWIMRSDAETWCLERESVMSVLGDWSDIKLSIRRHMAVIKVDIIFLQKNRLYQTYLYS